MQSTARGTGSGRAAPGRISPAAARAAGHALPARRRSCETLGRRRLHRVVPSDHATSGSRGPWQLEYRPHAEGAAAGPLGARPRAPRRFACHGEGEAQAAMQSSWEGQHQRTSPRVIQAGYRPGARARMPPGAPKANPSPYEPLASAPRRGTLLGGCREQPVVQGRRVRLYGRVARPAPVPHVRWTRPDAKQARRGA